MAKDTLQGLSVAILVTDGFEQVELTDPRKALDEAVSDQDCHIDSLKAVVCHYLVPFLS